MNQLWEQQWKLFALNFHSGKAHIPYGPDSEFPLLPGGGFGDASHPTTKLMLETMAPYVSGKKVLDLGCGSGILSIAAALMGATQIFAIDICPEAIEHTKKNIRLNKLEAIIQTGSSVPLTFQPQILCVNMIHEEQKQAFLSIQNSLPFIREILASGILTQDLHQYSNWLASFGFSRRFLKHKEEWCFLYFERDAKIGQNNS